jgi:hypothetical protein
MVKSALKNVDFELEEIIVRGFVCQHEEAIGQIDVWSGWSGQLYQE